MSGPHIGDEDDLSRLFAAFAAEVSLVRRDSDGALLHRSDVRRVMLRLLKADDPERVREIHTRAVEYYKARSGPKDRIEELYHRLALAQPAAVLDERWMPLAEQALEGAFEDLPDSSRLYLASRLGRDAMPSGWRTADPDVGDL